MSATQVEMQGSTEMLESEYHRMARMEAHLWWYRSLHADLLDLIHAHFGARRDIRVLDAGCGTGGFLSYLRRAGYTHCAGLDISPLAIAFCRDHGLDVAQGSIADAAALAARGKADLIVAMDVICSLPDESQRIAFLRAASKQLNAGGLLIVQTPAFALLGGVHDLAVGVNKRYTQAGMRKLLEAAGIDACRLRYRLLLLTPLVFVARSLQRLRLRFAREVTIESDVKMPPGPVNALLFHVQRFEDRWLPFRPVGTSLQIFVTKVGQE
jgi:SAM-dependent methyltransferase